MGIVYNPLLPVGLDQRGTGGGASVAGSNTEIQYNNSGSLGASADLTWDDTGKVLGVGGDVNLDDGGTYTTTLQTITPTANRTISFPDATGTVGLVAGASTAVIVNTSGAFAGYSGFTYDDTAGMRLNGKAFGYGSGSGGTQTQATSKSTTVILNSLCGTVTMNAAELAADTAVSFTLTNSTIAATDVVVLNHSSGGTVGAYTLNAQAAAGSATITVRNVTAGALSEAIVLRFAVIKASTT